MNEKKGDVYFRDIHGNFHKLDTKDFNEELAELSNYDNIIHSSKFEKSICNFKPLNYYELYVENVKNSNIENYKLNLDKGLYKFSIYLTINSSETQKIYFFLRDKKIIESSLFTTEVYSEIPNNINFHFILNLNDMKQLLEIAIISNKNLTSIESYILYSRIN